MAAKLGGTEKGALLKLLSPVTKEQDAATRLRRSPWPVNPYKPSVPSPPCCVRTPPLGHLRTGSYQKLDSGNSAVQDAPPLR